MGRHKVINDNELIQLIEEYFLEHGGRVGNLKYSNIAQYVRENGYPDFQDYVLRRNQAAREHIAKLRERQEEDISTLIAYKTFDVAGFMKDNPSKAKITSTLTALNKYYEKVSDSAVKVFRKYRDLENQISQLTKELDVRAKENEKLRSKNDSLKKANNTLKGEKDTYKRVVDKYVYPEIANKLLCDEGVALLPHDHIIDEPEIIMPDNVIPITGRLLSIFNKEEDEN